MADRLTAPLTWTTTGGDVLEGEAGDWVVIDATGGTRTVRDASFRATHQHVTGDVWRRRGEVWARPAVPGERLTSQEGGQIASLGDWIVTDDAGACWPVPGAHFAATYEPAEVQAGDPAPTCGPEESQDPQ